MHRQAESIRVPDEPVTEAHPAAESRAEPPRATSARAVAAPAPREAEQPDPSASADQRARQLREVLERHAGERHLVAIQDFPDPDAISSALAYRELARGLDIEVEIAYEGRISHPENLALVNLLEIELSAFRDDTPLDGYDGAVFVDNQGSTTRLTPRLREAGVPTVAVIDHHDPQELLEPEFTDIRAVAAAASQMAEYLRSGLFLTMEAANPQHVQLATALLHGLHSETRGFVQAGRAEFAAAEFLSPFVDRVLLEEVLCVQKSRGTMDTIERALAHRTIRGGLSVAGVGFVRWNDRDAIPQAADFLLSEENVHTAVVYGLVSDGDGREVVSGSLRTNNATLGVDLFLKQALGKDIRGQHFGGGRSRAGGFEIDVGFLSSSHDTAAERDTKWSLFNRQIRRKLFHAAGLEEESGAPGGANAE